MEKIFYEQLDEILFSTKLPNGLTVHVVPRKNFSKKLAYFVTDFGAIHTEFTFEGQQHTMPAGIAHYLEHTLFHMPEERDVSAEFAALGAITNAFTSYDMTAYYFSCTENFDRCLKLLLEFVSTPYFTKESVEKEQGIIAQEIGMYQDAPDSRVFENLMSTMYTQHPIRVPILGSLESIRQITPEKLHLCHRAFYTPGNMHLCVMGDVQPEEVVEIALQILGDEPREVAQKHNRWQEDLVCPARYTEDRMEVAMPMFSLAFKCLPAPMGEAGVREDMVAELAAEALFGDASELYLKMYEAGIIDSSFGGGFETLDGAALFTCSGDSNDPEEIRRQILAQAQKLVEQGIEKTEFERLRRSALGRRIRGLDSFDATCFRLCAYRFTNYDYFNFPEVYRSIRWEDVVSFLKRTVLEEHSALSVIFPKH
jgi:predicted Zn-dependent peptidase